MKSFAEVKAARDAAKRDAAAKSTAVIQSLNDINENTHPSILLGWCTATDSRLGRAISFSLSQVVSEQFFAYVKKDPETMPEISIPEINGVSSAIRLDLLQPVYDFLGISGLRDPAAPKPRRAQVSCGGMEAAAAWLLMESIARLDRHPDRGYKGIDGALAAAINRAIGAGLPVAGELEGERIFEWDVDPFQPSGVDATHDERQPREHDEEFTWDDTPEEEKTSATPGIHW